MGTELQTVPTLDTSVAHSLVVQGDLSGLTDAQRVSLYLTTCAAHGLNPAAQPFTFLRLNGKLVMYANRGAGDQLAAIHRLNREIIDGPKVVEFAGAKLGYCVARITHPNGRVETATATLAVAGDIAMLPMKLETKAKRRGTLAILGLAMLDESEVESIPARERGEVYTPNLGDLTQPPPAHVDARPELPPPAPDAWEAFAADVATVTTCAAATACWQMHAATLYQQSESVHARAGKYLTDHMVAMGFAMTAQHDTAMKSGNLDAALAGAYDALSTVALREGDDDFTLAVADVVVVLRKHGAGASDSVRKHMPGAGRRRLVALGMADADASAKLKAALTPTPPPTGTDGPVKATESTATAQGTGLDGVASTAPAALAAVPSWAQGRESMEQHVAGYSHARAVENAVRKYRTSLGETFTRMCTARLVALGIAERTAETLVAAWQRPAAARKAVAA